MKCTHNRNNKWKNSFNWHKWFAWHPVDDGTSIVLFEWVWRRRRATAFSVFWVYSFEENPPVTPES